MLHVQNIIGKGAQLLVKSRDLIILYLDKNYLTSVVKVLVASNLFLQKTFMDAWACHFPEQIDQQYQINYLLLNLIENRRVDFARLYK